MMWIYNKKKKWPRKKCLMMWIYKRKNSLMMWIYGKKNGLNMRIYKKRLPKDVDLFII